MTTAYRSAALDGLNVFYRQAGDPTAPAVLLLHGFPSSSHMFRELIPALAERYHVVAGICRASATAMRRTAGALTTPSIA
jgi:predicted esterase